MVLQAAQKKNLYPFIHSYRCRQGKICLFLNILDSNKRCHRLSSKAPQIAPLPSIHKTLKKKKRFSSGASEPFLRENRRYCNATNKTNGNTFINQFGEEKQDTN